MATYDMPASEFATSIGGSALSQDTINAILALTTTLPGTTGVSIAVFDPNVTVAAGTTVLQFGEGQVLTGDPGTPVIIMSPNAGGGTAVINADTPRTIVGSASAEVLTFQGNAGVTMETGGGNDLINTGSGNNNIVISGAGSPTIVTGTGDDIITLGGTGNRQVDLGDGNNTVILNTNSGTSTIVAGSGVDTLQVSGPISSHTLTLGANLTLLLNSSPTQLKGVDLIEFGSGVTVVSENRTKTDMARLYEVMFDRMGDKGGLKAWLNTVEAGASIFDVAKAFAGSPEFQNKFASMDNTAYLQALYQNMSGRGADQAGLQYWLGQMSNGMSRADVAVAFAGSAEAIQLMGINGTKYVIDLV